MKPALRRLFARVRVLALDVDGVLTDGGLYYGPRGDALKKFNVKDGLGLVRARDAGIVIALITGEDADSVRHRARKLKIAHVFTGVREKAGVLRRFLRSIGVPPSHAAYAGDDVTDVPAMNLVGLPIAVADAVPEAIAAARHVTSRCGGDAAVREVCDLMLSSR
jgi:3-deoxy-D-manno-octulosonate 8-phosphate phosphatase (KDO 8-P phosphatase)